MNEYCLQTLVLNGPLVQEPGRSVWKATHRKPRRAAGSLRPHLGCQFLGTYPWLEPCDLLSSVHTASVWQDPDLACSPFLSHI